jgi:hypothetical protein
LGLLVLRSGANSALPPLLRGRFAEFGHSISRLLALNRSYSVPCPGWSFQIVVISAAVSRAALNNKYRSAGVPT